MLCVSTKHKMITFFAHYEGCLEYKYVFICGGRGHVSIADGVVCVGISMCWCTELEMEVYKVTG